MKYSLVRIESDLFEEALLKYLLYRQ